jgi:hypothetical protein
MDKRSFLKNAGLIGIGSMIRPRTLKELMEPVINTPSAELARDEDFWERIRAGYRLKPDYINLENGYYCFLPKQILESQINHLREINYQGSYYMRPSSLRTRKKWQPCLPDLPAVRKMNW